MPDITIVRARRPEAVGSRVRVRGWVRTRRDSKGGFSFLELNDGSCLGNIQVIADGTLPNYESEIKRLTAGCSVTVEGEVQASPGKGQATEVHADQVLVHGWADPEDVSAAEETALVRVPARVAHLRPRTNTFGAIARVRNLRLPVDPRVLPGRGLSLHPHADHHGQRLRRGRGRCSTSPRSTSPICRRRMAAVDFTQRLLRPARRT